MSSGDHPVFSPKEMINEAEKGRAFCRILRVRRKVSEIKKAQITDRNERVQQLTNAMNLSHSAFLGRVEKHWLIAQEYRAERGLTDGYVICHNGQAVGWRRDLEEANGWVPGCYAFDSKGNDWMAVGGNDYDGAERWELIG